MRNEKVIYPEEAVKFGLYVQKHRKRKGYTQLQLAEIMGISTKSISFIERGIHFPTPNNIFKLAKVLDMSLDEFVFSYHKFSNTLCIEELNQVLSELNADKQKMLIGIIKTVSDYLYNNKS